MAQIDVSARSLHSDEANQAFSLEAGTSSIGQDHSIVLHTSSSGPLLRIMWDASIKIRPGQIEGQRALVLIRGTGSVFDGSFDSYLELETNLGDIEPDSRGILVDGVRVFIIDDLSAPTDPFITIHTVNNGTNMGQSWELEDMTIEFLEIT